MTRYLRLLPLLLLAGCATTPPAPPDRFYRLAAAAPTLTFEQPLADTMVVHMPRSDGLHQDRALLYSKDADGIELRQMLYHYWVDSPPALVQSQIVDYFRRSGIAGKVLRQAHATLPDIIVESRLERFEELMPPEAPPAVVVALELRAVMPMQHNVPVVTSHEIVQPISGNDMRAVAEGYRSALNQLLDRFVGELRKTLAQ